MLFQTLYVLMEYTVPILGLLAGVIQLILVSKLGNGFPRKDILIGLKGRKTIGQADLNGQSCIFIFIANEQQLGVKSHWPDIGILLEMDNLNIEEVKSFIGHRVKITLIDDTYKKHFFDHLVMSKRVANKLKKFSNGRFRYDNV